MSKNLLDGFYYNLSGGINLSKTKVGLGVDTTKLYWDDSFNVELLKNQGVCSQKGNTLLLKLGEPEEILGMFNYPKNTEDFVFVTKSGKIYYFDSNLSTVILKFSMTEPVSEVNFAQYLDGLLICSKENPALFFQLNSKDEFREINLKNAQQQKIHTSVVATFASRVWVASGSMLYFSALGRFNDWTAPDDAGYISKFHSSSSEIVALCEYNGCLAIYKTDGVYLLSGSSPEEFSIVRFADLGASSLRGVITENNKQYFINNDGVFALEQSGDLAQIALSNNVAYNIKPYFARFDTGRAAKTLALPYKIKNQIWFFAPFSDSDFLDTVWIYDYFCKAWFKRVIPYDITCAAAVFGKIYTATAQGEIFIENLGNSFNQKPIQFRFSTPFFHLGLPNTRKIIENLNFIFDEEYENSFKFSVSKDYKTYERTDIEFVETLQPTTLIYTDSENNSNNFGSSWASRDGGETDFCWSEPLEEAYKTEVFDSNVSVQLHIEGEKIGDEFAIVGIEFKEVLVDE